MTEFSLKSRDKCPVCGEVDASFLCRMDEEYLVTGEQGWQYDPVYLRLAGLQFEQNPDSGCSYFECSKCGSFYLKEIAQMEEVLAIYRKDYKPFVEPASSPSIVRSTWRQAHASGQMATIALQATQADSPAILDYGFGGGIDLGIFRALRVGTVVGYNPHNFAFAFVRKYVHPDIVLVSSAEELESYAPFDAIRCNAVLEHVSEPNAVLDHIYQLLKPGGVAWFSVPDFDSRRMKESVRMVEQSIKVKLLHPGHLQLWNRDKLSFATWVKSRGFQPVIADLDIPPRAVSQIKDALWIMAAHAKRGLQVARMFADMRLNRYKASAFLAMKPRR